VWIINPDQEAFERIESIVGWKYKWVPGIQRRVSQGEAAGVVTSVNDAARRLGMSYFSVITGVVAIGLSGILAKWTTIPGEASGARLWERGARLGVARPSARDVERQRGGEIRSVSESRQSCPKTARLLVPSGVEYRNTCHGS
jgi:hypothetical protein